jgi:hypothetical protein
MRENGGGRGIRQIRVKRERKSKQTDWEKKKQMRNEADGEKKKQRGMRQMGRKRSGR